MNEQIEKLYEKYKEELGFLSGGLIEPSKTDLIKFIAYHEAYVKWNKERIEEDKAEHGSHRWEYTLSNFK